MTLPRCCGARSAFVPLLLLAASAAALPAQERFYLHDKDTVVFYGDSITEQRLYTTFVETFVLTRYPQLNVRFVNSGWGRETVAGGDGGPVDLRLTRLHERNLGWRPEKRTIAGALPVVTSLERAGGTACPTYADAEPVLVAQAVPPARLSCYCPRGATFDLPGLTGSLNASGRSGCAGSNVW